MNIILTGFMGTGKTVVGRQLAGRLGATFIDVDGVIESEIGRSIRSIFETEGEGRFRDIERAVIARIAATDHAVISTGGGAVLDARNLRSLKTNSFLVCLTARVDTLLKRLKNDLNRPLLHGENPRQRIETLLEERKSAYGQCDLEVATDDEDIARLATRIFDAVRPYWGKNYGRPSDD